MIVLEMGRRELALVIDACLEADRLLHDGEFEILMGVTCGELAAVEDDLLTALRATPSLQQLPDTSHEEPS